TLASRGSVGMIHLIPESETFELYVRSRGRTRLYHRDRAVRSSFLPSMPALLAGPSVTRALLAGAMVDDNARPLAQPLAWSLRVEIESTRRPIEEANVACVLPGKGTRRDTAIVLSAHYDHLGVGLPDARGDSTYNGFSDNAAGVAMVLGIAEALTREETPPLGFSLLLLFFSGEERGLLGSDYYVAHPLWPLRQTAAVINLDAGAPPAPPVSWRVAGVDSADGTGLGALAARVAGGQGWQVVTSPARANSDYFPFHREGVPAMFIVPGSEAYEGMSVDSSVALRQRWDHYHQPADHWSPDFPFAGLARYAAFALMLVRALDRDPDGLRR
ncbi:MAG: M28 family peptidase, partial [Gemmatimonadota bacterium]|nr:M28 family peptidase [Gemmatimonadota bacterium]